MLTHHLPALRRPGAQLLAIGAHADDIEIGAGGTVLQLLSVAPATVDVRWVVLSATPARAEEARASAAAFCSDARSVTVDVHDLPDGRFPAEWGTLKETLQALAAETDPDLVLTTNRGCRVKDLGSEPQEDLGLRSRGRAQLESTRCEGGGAVPDLQRLRV